MPESALSDLYHRIRIREAMLDRLLHCFTDLTQPVRTFQEILAVAATGPVADKVKGMKLPPGIGMPGVVARDRRPIAVSDVKKEPTYSRERHKIAGYETTSLLAVPVLHKGDLTGVLELLNRRGYPDWAAHEIELLERIARAAGAMINLIGERR